MVGPSCHGKQAKAQQERTGGESKNGVTSTQGGADQEV